MLLLLVAFIAGAVAMIVLMTKDDLQLAAFLGFSPTNSHNRSRPVVVIDSWWSGDFAKNGCESIERWWENNKKLINQIGCESVTSCPEAMPRYTACTLALNGPKGEAWAFENELLTQFAINPSCKGARFARYSGPSENTSAETRAIIQESHWTLIIDYNVGATTQAWSLQDQKGAPHQAEGATATKVAADVCAIVMGQGGTLLR
jgi:hypothetical protein